jgi:hypothetical protein
MSLEDDVRAFRALSEQMTGMIRQSVESGAFFTMERAVLRQQQLNVLSICESRIQIERRDAVANGIDAVVSPPVRAKLRLVEGGKDG